VRDWVGAAELRSQALGDSWTALAVLTRSLEILTAHRLETICFKPTA
jgi:hypothetical protein